MLQVVLMLMLFYYHDLSPLPSLSKTLLLQRAIDVRRHFIGGLSIHHNALHVPDFHDVRLQTLLDNLAPNQLTIATRDSHALQRGVGDTQQSPTGNVML